MSSTDKRRNEKTYRNGRENQLLFGHYGEELFDVLTQTVIIIWTENGELHVGSHVVLIVEGDRTLADVGKGERRFISRSYNVMSEGKRQIRKWCKG